MPEIIPRLASISASVTNAVIVETDTSFLGFFGILVHIVAFFMTIITLDLAQFHPNLLALLNRDDIDISS